MLRSDGRSRTIYFAASALLIIYAISGCSGSMKGGATVKGTVKNRDRLLKSGTITFHGENNATASTTISPDGTYICEGVPTGDVKVTVAQAVSGSLPGGVMPPGPKPKVPEGAPPMPEVDPTLPALVGKLETTNLKFVIDGKEKTLDILIQ